MMMAVMIVVVACANHGSYDVMIMTYDDVGNDDDGAVVVLAASVIVFVMIKMIILNYIKNSPNPYFHTMVVLNRLNKIQIQKNLRHICLKSISPVPNLLARNLARQSSMLPLVTTLMDCSYLILLSYAMSLNTTITLISQSNEKKETLATLLSISP